MNFLPESLTRLIDELSRLPGIGPKSAQRLAFHILKQPEVKNQTLGNAVRNVKEGVTRCSDCFCLTSEVTCRVCSNTHRNKDLLCVVESTLDMMAIEKTGEFRGVYHVLGGRLSPLDGVGPEDLRLGELFTRLTESSGQREVILALNPDLEGDTTALFIQRKLQPLQAIQVSRIARGIPSGGHLEYTDDATLIRAIEGRQILNA